MENPNHVKNFKKEVKVEEPKKVKKLVEVKKVEKKVKLVKKEVIKKGFFKRNKK